MIDQGYKRENPRVERIFLTSLSKSGETGELESTSIGRTLNLSDGGIMLEVTEPIPFLAKVNLSVALEEYILEAKGEVVHLRKNPDGRIEMGIRFIDLSDDAREKLKNIVY